MNNLTSKERRKKVADSPYNVMYGPSDSWGHFFEALEDGASSIHSGAETAYIWEVPPDGGSVDIVGIICRSSGESFVCYSDEFPPLSLNRYGEIMGIMNKNLTRSQAIGLVYGILDKIGNPAYCVNIVDPVGQNSFEEALSRAAGIQFLERSTDVCVVRPGGRYGYEVLTEVSLHEDNTVWYHSPEGVSVFGTYDFSQDRVTLNPNGAKTKIAPKKEPSSPKNSKPKAGKTASKKRPTMKKR